jgi:hypothetical protein
MKKRLLFAAVAAVACAAALASCGKGGDEPPPPPPYVLKEADVRVEEPAGGFTATVNRLFRIEVASLSDEGVSYRWLLDGEPAAQTKNLEHMFEKAGTYALTLRAAQGGLSFDYGFEVTVDFGGIVPEPNPGGATAYITEVLDYMPAVGQFTNKLPAYEPGDTQETMNEKALAAIGNNAGGMITLGGFGGYVTVGFDHTIGNAAGKRDFRVLGNAFLADENPELDAPQGGSCEPGVIAVAYDANKNGVPDDNEWYEIAGSAHEDPAGELWYQMAADNGNDVNLCRDYSITYHRPASEPASKEEWGTYIRWEDNKGNSGYKAKVPFHAQPYYPLWAAGDELTFSGTRLPQNAIDESGTGNYYVLYKFRYGYADNEPNAGEGSAIDIDWAVNDKGQKVHLPGVDFIRIYTGVNQESGNIGECSTEICGIEDLHVLGVSINTP